MVEMFVQKIAVANVSSKKLMKHVSAEISFLEIFPLAFFGKIVLQTIFGRDVTFKALVEISSSPIFRWRFCAFLQDILCQNMSLQPFFG